MQDSASAVLSPDIKPIIKDKNKTTKIIIFLSLQVLQHSFLKLIHLQKNQKFYYFQYLMHYNQVNFFHKKIESKHQMREQNI